MFVGVLLKYLNANKLLKYQRGKDYDIIFQNRFRFREYFLKHVESSNLNDDNQTLHSNYTSADQELNMLKKMQHKTKRGSLWLIMSGCGEQCHGSFSYSIEMNGSCTKHMHTYGKCCRRSLCNLSHSRKFNSLTETPLSSLQISQIFCLRKNTHIHFEFPIRRNLRVSLYSPRFHETNF